MSEQEKTKIGSISHMEEGLDLYWDLNGLIDQIGFHIHFCNICNMTQTISNYQNNEVLD